MLLQVRGTRYQIGFEHQYDIFSYMNGKPLATPLKMPYQTSCYIKQFSPGGEPVLVAEGIAECHPNDQYNKAKGRKIAMARALKELFPDDKGTRAVFWSLYRLRTQQQKREPNGNRVETKEVK